MEPYEFASPRRVELPGLAGEAVVRDNGDEAIDALLADLLLHAMQCVRALGDFVVFLSGTPEAEPLLRRLMYDPPLRDFPWARTRVFLASDLDVGESDPRSQSAAVRAHVVDQSDLPESQFYPLGAERGDRARAYERRVREILGWREKGHDRPDFVLLTVGEGGRVAGVDDGHAPSDWLFSREDGPGPARISATSSFVNAARLVAVLATGSGAARLARAPGEIVPRLAPLAGELRWYVDGSRLGAGGAG